MIEVFDTGIKILLLLTPLFFLVLFRLSFGWSRMKYKETNINLMIGTIVGVFYSFLFFLIGVIIVSLISLSFKYLPSFIKLFSI